MASNGEIYHLAFKIRNELLKNGIQMPLIEIRDALKGMNEKNIPFEEMEKKLIEISKEKYVKK
jgi:hypothetical protein